MFSLFVICVLSSLHYWWWNTNSNNINLANYMYCYWRFIRETQINKPCSTEGVAFSPVPPLLSSSPPLALLSFSSSFSSTKVEEFLIASRCARSSSTFLMSRLCFWSPLIRVTDVRELLQSVKQCVPQSVSYRVSSSVNQSVSYSVIQSVKQSEIQSEVHSVIQRGIDLSVI